MIATSYDNIGRIYHINGQKYYSVTTVLGATKDTTFLDNWRKIQGKEKSDKMTRQAAGVGTDFHSLGEAFLLKQPLPDVQWLPKMLFEKAIPILTKNVTSVHSVEQTLYSNIARIAGRVDSVLYWKNELSIFDFKCIGHLNPAWLEDYWLQTTIYKLCLEEIHGLKATKLVLLCANKKSLTVKYFEEDPKKFIKKAAMRIKKFRKMLDTGELKC